MFRRGTEVPGFKLKSSADKIWIFSSIFPNQSMDEIGLNQREKKHNVKLLVSAFVKVVILFDDVLEHIG